jgi:hypothetical protein
MALITTYATLQSEVALWINRIDLTDTIKSCIQLAEKRLGRDYRVRDPDGATSAIVALSDSATSNWLLTLSPDIYLYATLVELSPFLIEDDRVPLWEAELQKRLEDLAGNVRVNSARTTITNTTHATLIRAVLDFTNRGDLSPVVPLLIINAERALARDTRVKNLATATLSVVAGDNLAVPTSMKSVQGWYHDGSTYYGAIEIVAPDQIGALKARYGATGVPLYAAIVDSKFRFAPVPDATYSTKITYWQGLTALSGGANWLHSAHPDIYLYATLVEAAVWMKDGEMKAAMQAELEKRLEELHLSTWEFHYSGTMVRPITPFGG